MYNKSFSLSSIFSQRNNYAFNIIITLRVNRKFFIAENHNLKFQKHLGMHCIADYTLV